VSEGKRALTLPRSISKGLLKPLGHSAQNTEKFFAKVELGDLKRTRNGSPRATLAISLYWQNRNARKTK
jgi:hypothetical protein